MTATEPLGDLLVRGEREYGFASWPRLKRSVETSRGLADAIDAFLRAAADQRGDAAREIAEREPRIVSSSIHVAAILGYDDEVARQLEERPARIRERIGPHAADPLISLCYSPFHGESPERDEALLRTTRTLLSAGADPNASTIFREGSREFAIPALYAVTGLHNAPRIARALLEAGARPNDGESLFHAAQLFHRECLELLLEFGADPNENGEWGNTPLYFLLDHFDESDAKVRLGIDWLLAHGADPNVVSGKQHETALHVAIRRGRSPELVRLLLEHGADVHLRRADGRTPWLLARQAGNDTVVALLEGAGAEPQSLSPADELLAACGRGDADAARGLGTSALVASLTEDDRKLLPSAAAAGRADVVRACLAAGFPVDQEDDYGGAALHNACIHGNAEIASEVLRHGPDLELRDRAHDATPLGWAAFGADHFKQSVGDHVACVRVLLEAGAKLLPTDRWPQDPAVAALLASFLSDSPGARSG